MRVSSTLKCGSSVSGSQWAPVLSAVIPFATFGPVSAQESAIDFDVHLKSSGSSLVTLL